ncbi:hypothetical protein SELMODRAFT_135826 [Selaginella moellendorffii]|uniref:Pentacotripeptide-repeat region of PRORP domain-containing protein n=2 Tax=Selaginella moellendorffii TaxID=88036 RepID=D8TAX6_SELML|nr:hypothetical protein SELMODRAFT_135826 [Selaginella moellendorffii]
MRFVRGRRADRSLSSHQQQQQQQQQRQPAVMSILHELQDKKSSKSHVLDKYARHIPVDGFMALVDEIGRLNDWALALALFKWLQKNEARLSNRDLEVAHAKIIDTMGKQGQLRLASWIFSQLQLSSRTTPVFNAIIMAHLRCKNVARALDSALDHFGHMKTSVHSCPSLATYNMLTRACAQAGLTDKAEALFLELLRRDDLKPDAYTFNGIMDAYAKKGLYRDMEYKLKEMSEHGVRPDLVTFNVLIDAYGRAGDFVKMERTYKSLVNLSGCKPSATTFNSMLASYGQSRELGKMEQVLVRMDMAGLGPDLTTFNTLMSSYGRAGELDTMRKCFDKMVRSPVKPQVSTLDVLLRAYAEHGLVDEAEALFINASKLDIKPAVSSYLILFKAYGEERQLDKMTVLMSKMEQSGVESGQEFLLQALESYAATPHPTTAPPVIEDKDDNQSSL